MHLSSHGHFQSEWLSLWSLHDILAHSASFNGAFEAFGFVLARMKAGRQKHLHKWCFMWHKAMLVGHRLRHWCCKLRRMWKGLAHPQMYSGLKEGFLYTKTVLLSIVSRSKNNSGRETPYKLSIVWRKQKNLFKVSLHYRWLSGGPSALLTWALVSIWMSAVLDQELLNIAGFFEETSAKSLLLWMQQSGGGYMKMMFTSNWYLCEITMVSQAPKGLWLVFDCLW